MVKVGFIVEGDSEKIVVESSQFNSWLNAQGYQIVRPVINAKGGGNLLPQNIGIFLEQIKKSDPEAIFVITDLEQEQSVEVVRERINSPEVDLVFVAIKALEAWFLADTKAMCAWLNITDFEEEYPEQTQGLPWQQLKDIAARLDKRGPGSKASFAKLITRHHGFDVTQAAQHPNCKSAQEIVAYFLAHGESASAEM